MESKPAPIVLAPKYYLHDFEYLLGFVEKMYGDLLIAEERQFIDTFRGLSEDARCLYVRMMNRKGVFFRPGKFSYAEITSVPAGLHVLESAGLASSANPDGASACWDFLKIFTKAELWGALSHFTALAQAKNWRKDELMLLILESIGQGEYVPLLQATDPVVQLRQDLICSRLQFFFFGSLYQGMTEFVVRDVGHMRYEAFNTDSFTPLFKSRAEADDKWLVSIAYEQFKQYQHVFTPEEMVEWFEASGFQQHRPLPLSEAMFAKLIGRLGRWLERLGEGEKAMAVYKCSELPPARERLVRLLVKGGQNEEALQLCRAIAEAPANAEELFFAADYTNKLLKKTARRATTAQLKDAPLLLLPNNDQLRVEQAVLAHFQTMGTDGFFSENWLWRAIFGLTFWDLIFDEEAGAIHHPLQRAPSDLDGQGFFKLRKAKIDQRLRQLATPKKMLRHLAKAYEAKEGMANPFVGWHPDTLAQLSVSIPRLPMGGLQAVLLEMARNPKENSRGFPDLFLLESESYRLVEVKSPNDQLSAQQLYWLHFMQKVGIMAEVLRVDWE